MEQSAFQFTPPELKYISYKSLDSFKPEVKANVEIQVRSTVSEIVEIPDSEEQSATVSVSIKVGQEEENSPFVIEVTEAALFKWNKAAYSEEQLDALLTQNTVALLISYIRPIIAGVTAASRYPSYNLPYLDVTVMKKEN